jgi:hypothetical protein
MTEKLIHSLPPTTALPPFVTFEDCQKGETAAKTGCTPSSGGGGKKPTDEEIDEFEKDLIRRKEEMDKGGSGEGEAPASEETGGESKGSPQEQFDDLKKAEESAFSDDAYAKSYEKAIEKHKQIETEEALVGAAWEVASTLQSRSEENKRKIKEGKVDEIDLAEINDLNREADMLDNWIQGNRQ